MAKDKKNDEAKESTEKSSPVATSPAPAAPPTPTTEDVTRNLYMVRGAMQQVASTVNQSMRLIEELIEMSMRAR